MESREIRKVKVVLLVALLATVIVLFIIFSTGIVSANILYCLNNGQKLPRGCSGSECKYTCRSTVCQICTTDSGMPGVNPNTCNDQSCSFISNNNGNVIEEQNDNNNQNNNNNNNPNENGVSKDDVNNKDNSVKPNVDSGFNINIEKLSSENSNSEDSNVEGEIILSDGVGTGGKPIVFLTFSSFMLALILVGMIYYNREVLFRKKNKKSRQSNKHILQEN